MKKFFRNNWVLITLGCVILVFALELSGVLPQWLSDALHRGARNALRSG